jgi:hypothetical protein
VNGDFSIDIVDALLVAQKYVSIIVDPFIESAANVNCDENIDIIDALLIAQYYVKLIDQFPLCGGTPTPIPTPANPTPEPTPVDPPPFILGDVNGSGTVDIIDCILLTQYISGLNPEPFNEEAADINGDGVIDEADSLLLCYPIYTN